MQPRGLGMPAMRAAIFAGPLGNSWYSSLIDTPEVFFGAECYGPQASAATKRLLPSGARVRLLAERSHDELSELVGRAHSG